MAVRRRIVVWVVIASVGAAGLVIAARAAAPDPPYPEALLYVDPLYITVDGNGFMCIDEAVSVGRVAGVVGGIAEGPLSILGAPQGMPDGRFRIEGNGHTVVVAEGSDVAIVDGRPFQLEAEVKWPNVATGPLNRLGWVLGYDIRVGYFALPSNPFHEEWGWIVRVPRGVALPRSLVVAREVLTTERSAVLVYEVPDLSEWYPCGLPSAMSGSFVVDANGPWADAEQLAAESWWTVSWDRTLRRGAISAEGRTAHIAVQSSARPLAGVVTVNGRPYPVPAELTGHARAGDPLVPLGPVARALRWTLSQPYSPMPIWILKQP